MHTPNSFTPPWWRWPTILSLDAPVVTMLWQWLVADAARVSLHWYHYTIVGLSIWLAYAADRWLEGWRVPPAQLQTPRHRFYYRHRRMLAGVWLVILAGALGLSFTRLTGRELAAGTLLLGSVVAYLVSHQFVHRGHSWRVPKEACIAGLLGGGAAVFAACAPDVQLTGLVEGTAWFVALAFVSCALIGRWEQVVDQKQGQDSLVLWYPWIRRLVPWLPWLILGLAAAGCGIGHGDRQAMRSCALASAALLAVIDRAERRTGWPLARVLADAALLSPAVWLAKVWFST